MPRARSLKNGQLSEAYNPATCSVCGAVISNKTDLPRHMKIHSTDRDKLMHRCPYPDCTFENLQKSNVETHIRTHTRSKTNSCPDCDFTTVDPGSLTRHRKRIHGYIPKMRRLRQPKPDAQDANGQSSVPLPPKPLDVRFSPYIIPPEQQAHKAARSAPIHSAKPTPSPPATLHRAVFESRSPSPASSRSRSRSLTPNSFVLPRPPSHSPQPPKRLPPPSALLRGVPPGGHVFKVQLGVGTGSSR